MVQFPDYLAVIVIDALTDGHCEFCSDEGLQRTDVVEFLYDNRTAKLVVLAYYDSGLFRTVRTNMTHFSSLQ